MKKQFMFLAAAALLFAGCDKSNNDPPIDPPEEYSVAVTAGEGGTASADKTKAEEGETITLTATADGGYEFVEWTVTAGNVTLLPDNTTATATFMMPAEAVKVKAEFLTQAAEPHAITLKPAGFAEVGDVENIEVSLLKAYVDDQSQWVTGSNGYGDIAYARAFTGTPESQLSKVVVWLLNGYQGDAEDITVKLYSLDASGLPATLLGTSDAINTSDISSSMAPYTFTFATPVSVPADFAVAVGVPVYGPTSTDIVVLSSDKSSLTTMEEINKVLSYGSPGWEIMAEAWGITDMWLDLAIFPTIMVTP